MKMRRSKKHEQLNQEVGKCLVAEDPSGQGSLGEASGRMNGGQTRLAKQS